MGSQLARDLALEVFRQPLLARQLKRNPLPEGMLDVIQIAAGVDTNITQTDDPHLREAAIFFLQQVLVSTHSDKFRLLGLRPGANIDLIREHRRWLLKWLHPDRNHNKWESTLFTKVHAAAATLEASGLRALPQETRRQSNSTSSRRRRFPHKTLKLRRLVPKWKIAVYILKRCIAVAVIVWLAALGIGKLSNNKPNQIVTTSVQGQ